MKSKFIWNPKIGACLMPVGEQVEVVTPGQQRQAPLGRFARVEHRHAVGPGVAMQPPSFGKDPWRGFGMFGEGGINDELDLFRVRDGALRREGSVTRWQIISLIAAVLIVGQGLLLWYYPTSVAVWVLAAIFVVFGVLLYFDPQYRQSRLSRWLYGVAVLQSLVPTLEVSLNTEPVVLHYVSASSPWCTTLFMWAGLLHSWWAHRESTGKQQDGGSSKLQQKTTLIGSPHATPISIGGNVILSLSSLGDEVVQELVGQNGRLIGILQEQLSNNSAEGSTDTVLVWRLIEDVRKTRRAFELPKCAELCRQLESLMNAHEHRWPVNLRREALIILAEQERSEIATARDRGEQIDLTRLRALIERIRNVN